MLRQFFSFRKLNDVSSEDEKEDNEEVEEEAEEDIILSTSKITSSHEINNFKSFELKNRNKNVVLTLLDAPNLNNDISTLGSWHVNKNCYIFANLNSLKSQEDLTVGCWSWIFSRNINIVVKN